MAHKISSFHFIDFLGDKQIDDYTKHQLLSNHWQPSDVYAFPYSLHMMNGKETRRYFRPQFFNKYPWLVYSHAKQGLFCKYCPFFATGGVGGGQKTVPLQKLVTKPLTNFKDLSGQKGDLETHSNNLYHKRAAEQASAFIRAYNSPKLEVINLVNAQRLREVEENRERLRPIVETIVFLGRQNLAFRGHRDDGHLVLDATSEQSVVSMNEGNFRELLKFRVSAGDKNLEKHLQSASSNATYISKTTQNSLISCCGKEILDQILIKVRASKFYSILFDETTDVAHMSQLSLVIRYLHEGSIREDFIGFLDSFEELGLAKQANEYDSDEEDLAEVRKLVAAEQNLNGNSSDASSELSLTGKAIGQIVLYQLKKKLKLPLDRCVGIGTDGCAVMLSEVRGAATIIQHEATNAVKAPCYSHKLNLSISRSSKVPSIRNAVGVMKEVISFFEPNPKRKTVLMGTLGCSLKSLCETRWVERHEGVLQFSVDLLKIVESLEKISEWRDPETASKAASLIASLTSPQFIVAVLCLSDVLSLTKCLSAYLQKITLDLNNAATHVESTISVLSKRRENIDINFRSVWQRAERLAEHLDIELKVPRIARRYQNYRANYQTDSAEQYYRVSVYAPLLDFVLTDLRERFSEETLDIFQLPVFIPDNIIKSSADQNEEVAKSLLKRFGMLSNIDNDIGFLLLRDEMLLWKEKWEKVKQQQRELPFKALDVLINCDKDAFPLVHNFLQILATLPVTTASAERSFSSLRRLKLYLRSTMGEERLSGLALLHIHRNMPLDIDNVITRFAKTGNKKRLEFSI